MSKLKYWLWLSGRKGVTTVNKAELLKALGDPENIYNADANTLASVCEMTAYAADSLLDKNLDDAQRIIDECAKLHIRIMTMQDSLYPSRLLQIYDPPEVLYIKGHMPDIDDHPAIGIVGTRKCSAYGLTCAEEMGEQLAKGGAIVISGLANGIDQAALKGAVKSGKPTIGVMGCGLDVPYPKGAAKLKNDMLANGAIISEYPPGTPARAQNFPPRNRIISGLSLGITVIEAPIKSGALITARMAYEQNRDVFVHPGTVEDEVNQGNYELMRDGAKPVRNGAEVLCEYVHLFPKRITLEKAEPKKPLFSKKKSDDEVSDEIMKVLDGDEAVHIDEIIARTKLSASQVLSNLTILEITGAVKQLPGKHFQREPGW